MTALLLTALLAAVDLRLATAATVFVQPVDQLEDDRPVAACVARHLPTALPLTVVDTPSEADLTLRVEARVFGGTHRELASAVGGRAAVDLGAVTVSAWIGDRRVWRDSTSVSAGDRTKRTLDDDHCSLADAAIEDLRRAMRKARK